MSSNPFPIFPLYLARLPRIASSSAAASASSPANKGRQVLDHYIFEIKIKELQTYLLFLPAYEDDLPILAVLVSELSAPASSSSSPHTASCVSFVSDTVFQTLFQVPDYFNDGGEHRHPY